MTDAVDNIFLQNRTVGFALLSAFGTARVEGAPGWGIGRGRYISLKRNSFFLSSWICNRNGTEQRLRVGMQRVGE